MDANNIKSIIEKIYFKIGYFDKYGGSIISVFLILLIFFIILSYFNVMTNIKPIRKNWNQQKCSPSVIPFAGIINKPPNMTSFEYTSANFSECINSIQTSITGDFLQPIYYVINTVKSSLDGITNDIQNVRKKITSLVDNLVSIDSKIMGKIMGFLMPIRKILIKIKDSLSKILGVGITTTYTTIGLWLSIETFIKAFVTIMLDGLYAMVAILVLLWILPFTWELAAAYTAIFGTAAALIATVLKGADDIIDSTRGVPKAPMCFDENTKITLEDGTNISIKNVDVNMTLCDGGVVTSIFKVSQNNMNMYNYNGVVVSENHNVLYNNKWVPVSNILEAKQIDNYDKDTLYCLNTTTKKIIIHNIIFSDWDDIDDQELIFLRKKMHDLYGLQIHYNNIHTFIDGGFDEDTIIKLYNGENIKIKDVKINDILSLGNVVKGVVKISTTNMNIQRFMINDSNIVSAPNNIINDNDLGQFSTLDIPSISISPRKKPGNLYHIITDNGLLFIEGIVFNHYNSSIEHFLED